MACYDIEGEKNYATFSGLAIDLETGEKGAKYSPFYSEYYHVKIVDGEPEVMPYHCSPFEFLRSRMTFSEYVAPDKKWCVAREGFDVYVIFNNDKTDYKDVLYTKKLASESKAEAYLRKKVSEKVGKGYASVGTESYKFVEGKLVSF